MSVTLGTDQLKWLRDHGTVDLNHWRLVLADNKPDWVYVGDWRPGPMKPFSSIDGGYLTRTRNLEKDRYFYWPK
jgi:hypothetical protein